MSFVPCDDTNIALLRGICNSQIAQTFKKFFVQIAQKSILLHQSLMLSLPPVALYTGYRARQASAYRADIMPTMMIPIAMPNIVMPPCMMIRYYFFGFLSIVISHKVLYAFLCSISYHYIYYSVLMSWAKVRPQKTPLFRVLRPLTAIFSWGSIVTLGNILFTFGLLYSLIIHRKTPFIHSFMAKKLEYTENR